MNANIQNESDNVYTDCERCHTFYFTNKGFGMEVLGFEDGFVIIDPDGIKNKKH